MTERPSDAAAGGAKPGALARGDVIGRYTILAPIGRGGVGEVYAAYDPELDRKVALKLIHAGGGADSARAQARLLREAKSMAKLSHANVVAVHDAGTFEGRVFVAMEFVDGATLRDWLAARPRAQSEILAVFVRAAHGLGAAHAAGLVHRDFKPGNVMIGKDGSVRVTDLGLARSFVAGEADDLDAEISAPDDLRLTRTGELLGTPLFMAPEQFLGLPADARTDQFSFCVALYRALYGAAPFGEDTLEAVKAKVLAGEIAPAPPKSAVPSWLRRVLARGLSVDPAARWPSMDALVAALARDPSRTRRRGALVVGTLTIVALFALAIARDARRPAQLCLGGPARIGGAWEGAGARRRAVESAFLASSAPAAAEVWQRVAAQLDRYAGEWLAMYREACEATNVAHTQPASLLDLRMSCLDERRTAVAALTDVLAHADREVVSNAVDAVRALPSVARCADAGQLRAAVEPPRDEATRARVDELRRRLAAVQATKDAGKHLEARDRARVLVGEARRIGYRPVLAEALALLVSSHAGGLEPDLRTFDVEEAVWTSLASGREDLAAQTAIAVLYLTWMTDDRDRHEVWLNLTKALLDRLPPGHEILRAWFLHGEGVRQITRDPSAALTTLQEAYAIKEKVQGPEDPDTARTLASIADAFHELHQNDEALRLVERAHAVMARAYGPASTEAAIMLGNRGEYLIDLGRAEQAIPALRASAALLAAQLGATNPNLGYALTDLGRALAMTGKPHEAISVLSRALELRARGEFHAALIAETRFALARALWDTGDPRAHALAAKAREEFARDADGAHDVHVAERVSEQVSDVDAWLAAHGGPPTRRRTPTETPPSPSLYNGGDGR